MTKEPSPSSAYVAVTNGFPQSTTAASSTSSWAFFRGSVKKVSNFAVVVAEPRSSRHKNGRTSPNCTDNCSITSERLHQRVGL